jgi:hypothetical protein
LLGDREALQRRLAALPPTLSHHYPMRRNRLTVRRESQPESLAAVNWGLVGVSPLGTDAGCLFDWPLG